MMDQSSHEVYSSIHVSVARFLDTGMMVMLEPYLLGHVVVSVARFLDTGMMAGLLGMTF